MITASNFEELCHGTRAASPVVAPKITLADVFARLAKALDADVDVSPIEHRVRGYARPKIRNVAPILLTAGCQ